MDAFGEVNLITFYDSTCILQITAVLSNMTPRKPKYLAPAYSWVSRITLKSSWKERLFKDASYQLADWESSELIPADASELCALSFSQRLLSLDLEISSWTQKPNSNFPPKHDLVPASLNLSDIENASRKQFLYVFKECHSRRKFFHHRRPLVLQLANISWNFTIFYYWLHNVLLLTTILW